MKVSVCSDPCVKKIPQVVVSPPAASESDAVIETDAGGVEVHVGDLGRKVESRM